MSSEELVVAKIGGSIIERSDELYQFLQSFARLSQRKILVHGGGSKATAIAERMGIEVLMVEGRRITDENMLDVVVMVYGGLINKAIVSRLQAAGCNALGLTGADGNVIPAHKREIRDIDYGYVGDIKKVNIEPIVQLLSDGFTPILAPLTHDQHGNMLNTNADTIASQVAGNLSRLFRTQMCYCFEKSGVLTSMQNDQSVISRLPYDDYRELKENGTISVGMIPKLETGYEALRLGANSVHICHANDFKDVVGKSMELPGTQLIL